MASSSVVVGMASSSAVVTLNPKEVSFRSFCSIRAHPTNTNQHLFNELSFTREGGFKRLSQPIHAVNSELDTSVTDMKDIGVTLKKSKVVIESTNEDTIKVRVDLTGKDTQKVFDDVLTNLARTAPAVPGFRKMKGGKTSNVPRDFLVRAIGEARVIKFVIQEIVSTTMTEYVEAEGLKVKKEFKTIQTPEELEALFEPGNPFGFSATLDIEKLESEPTASSTCDV